MQNGFEQSLSLTALVERLRQEFSGLLDVYGFGGGYETPSPVEAVARTLLALDTQETRKVSIRRAVQSLQGIGVHFLGAVTKNARANKNGYYWHRYGHVFRLRCV